MKKFKKKYLLLFIPLGVVTATCFFLIPHSKTNTVKQPIKDKLPQTNIDNSDKDAFHFSKNEVAKKYNDFCFKHGIIGSDDPNFDKLFDLDHSGYDCDESEKTTKKYNNEEKTKLVSLYDSKNLNNEDKNLQKSVVFVTDKEIDIPKKVYQEPKTVVKEVLKKQDPVNTFIPNETPKEEPKPVIKPFTEAVQTQQQNNNHSHKKELMENRINSQVKFIIDTVNLQLNTEFKNLLKLKENLTQLVPNLNLKINEITMLNNPSILSKLENENINVNVNGKYKQISIKELLLKQPSKLVSNGKILNEEEISLWNKYNSTTDLMIKLHASKRLLELGIDINQIKEEI